MKIFMMKMILLMILGLAVTSCSSLGARDFNFYLDNDTSRDIYDARVITDTGTPLIKHPPEGYTLRARESINEYGITLRSIPRELTVQWNEDPQGPRIERRISVREVLGRNFSGTTFVSILENGSLALSWQKRDKDRRVVGCGGYIYETYYDRAKPRIERNLKYSREAYLKRKEADLAAGKTELYKEDGYPDSLSDIAFKCNFRPYMEE